MSPTTIAYGYLAIAIICEVIGTTFFDEVRAVHPFGADAHYGFALCHLILFVGADP
ncbi:ethidium bromide-methyl viologen resistance protein EmrE [Psychrobacter sp. JCM 18900]|nr:ethidium bromide-methyl viologen resistance protein EmrE [Psychrobacter sp. JCM 18900]